MKKTKNDINSFFFIYTRLLSYMLWKILLIMRILIQISLDISLWIWGNRLYRLYRLLLLLLIRCI